MYNMTMWIFRGTLEKKHVGCHQWSIIEFQKWGATSKIQIPSSLTSLSAEREF